MLDLIDWDGLRTTVEQVPDWALLLVVLLAAAVEATPVLGVIMPANTIVAIIAWQWATVHKSPVELLAAYTVGSFLGDIVFYGMGRRYGLGFMERWPGLLRLSPERRAGLERLFHAHGVKTVVLARFQPGTRSFAPYVAGAAKLSAPRFLAPAGIASAIMACVVVGGGYLAGVGLARLGQALGWTLTAAVLVVVGLALLYFWATRKMRFLTETTLTLALVAAVGSALAAALALDAARRGRFVRMEESLWPHVLAGLAPLRSAADVLNAALGLQTLLWAFVAVVVWHLARRRWREMYLALLAGPVLFALAAWLRTFLARPAPAPPPAFPLLPGYPEPTAALAVALAGVLLWHWLRPGQNRWVRKAGIAGALIAALLVGLVPLATGQAWPTETIGGFALGGAWVSLCLLADTLAFRIRHADVPLDARHSLVAWSRRGWDRVTGWCDRHVAGNGRLLAGLVGLGLLLRLPGIWASAFGPDGFRYAAMGHALADTGAFWMPWGDVHTPGVGPQPSHHFPPLFPATLAGAYKVFGFSEASTRLVALGLAFAAVAVMYACTRDLYGKRKALVAAAVVSLDPVLVLATGKGSSENLLLITFILALWAILRSLERPWFIVLGALFAGLGYLTKSSLGAFFVLAGVGGLAWRLHWRGARALAAAPYLVAITLFLAIAAAWAHRNWRLFGSWQTSAHVEAAYANALADPAGWALLLVFSLQVVVGVGYLAAMTVAAWLPRLHGIPRLASEHDSGLWLAFLLPILLTVPVDAALWLYEGESRFDSVRYVSFAVVPLVWLLLRNVTLTKPVWAAVLASFAILVAASAWAALPDRDLVDDVSDRLGPLVQDGDTVAFVDWDDVYRFYFDVTDDGRRSVAVQHATGEAAQGITADWAVVKGNGTWIDRDRYVPTFGMQQGAEEWTVWSRAQAP